MARYASEVIPTRYVFSLFKGGGELRKTSLFFSLSNAGGMGTWHKQNDVLSGQHGGSITGHVQLTVMGKEAWC